MHSIKHLRQRFSNLKKIGGGMNTVYSAVDNNSTNDEIALKIIPINTFDELKLYTAEVKTLQSLNHVNIIDLKSKLMVNAGENRFGVLIFERLEMNFLSYLTAGNAKKEVELKAIFRNICQGLAYLHEKKIAHCDIKPENILLQFTRQGEKRILQKVKICDFGFAKRWNQSPYHVMDDGKKVLLGTKEYLAPELHKANSRYSLEKADIWSLGVMLYSAMTGYLPFVYDNEGNVTSSMDLRLLLNTCVDDLCYNLVSKLLHPSYRKRPSMAEILNDPWLL